MRSTHSGGCCPSCQQDQEEGWEPFPGKDDPCCCIQLVHEGEIEA